MTTMIMDPVTEGSTYTVRFTNRATSTGSVLVVLGWVPKHGNPVPAPQHMVIAPGAPPDELTGTVLPFASVRRMVIIASLDAGESGRLELLENGAPHSNESVSETTTWEILVEARP